MWEDDACLNAGREAPSVQCGDGALAGLAVLSRLETAFAGEYDAFSGRAADAECLRDRTAVATLSERGATAAAGEL